MSKCQNGWRSQHKFEARFDESEPIIPDTLRSFKGEGFDVFCRKTYVHEICVKCGEVVKRDTQEK